MTGNSLNEEDDYVILYLLTVTRLTVIDPDLLINIDKRCERSSVWNLQM